MNREHLILGTLLSLFDLASELPRGSAGVHASSRITTLAGRLGVSATALRAALLHLESRDLVDAERVRLTMKGLAIAAAFRAQSAKSARSVGGRSADTATERQAA